MKLYFLLITLLIFLLTSPICAQEKSQALKFDEFDDSVESRFYSYDNKEISFSQRIERFIKQLKKERGGGAKVYIIYYQARITDSSAETEIKNKVNRVQNQIQNETQIKSEDIFEIDGGYREKNTIEFWIAPKNAAPPAPTPTFEKSETFICPNFYISGYASMDKAEAVSFNAPAYNFEKIENYTLTWRVSAGEIVEGQGLNFIRVKLNDSAVKRVPAYLEVGGLPFPCPKVFSATAEVNGELRQVDEFGMAANGDIKARMDNFMVELQNEPTTTGYIVIYGSRGERNRDAERRFAMIKNYIMMRGYDPSRITIIRGGSRENISTEFWVAYNNAAPIPAPTVDEKFIVAPKPKTKPRSRKKESRKHFFNAQSDGHDTKAF